jgi:hypothetical protein
MNTVRFLLAVAIAVTLSNAKVADAQMRGSGLFSTYDVARAVHCRTKSLECHFDYNRVVIFAAMIENRRGIIEELMNDEVTRAAGKRLHERMMIEIEVAQRMMQDLHRQYTP